MLVRSKENIKDNLLKFFSSPFIEFNIEGDKRFLKVSKEAIEDYRTHYVTNAHNIASLIIAHKKSVLAQNNQSWNCRVITFDDLSELFTELINIKLQAGEKSRHQVMISSMGHFSNLDIEITGTINKNIMSIAVLDASGGSLTYKFALLPTLRSLKSNYSFVKNVFYTQKGIHNDELSCMVFAYHIANQLRKLPDFHTYLAQHSDPDGEVKWPSLPLCLLKLAQSKSFIESITDVTTRFCNNKRQTLLNYFVSHRGFFANDPDKERNFASIDLFLKLMNRLKPIVQQSSSTELLDIIDGKISCPVNTEKQTQVGIKI